MTEEVKQKSMIEMIAEQMHKQVRHNSFYNIKEAADVGTMPALASDEDNAAEQNAKKKNAPGEKAVPKGPAEVKGGAGGSTARKADKGSKATSSVARVQMDPDNKKAYDAMGVKLGESKDVDTDNVNKALKHDCASHVVHKEHGEGRCIPGMHTLEEDENGEGYVTHYDVMFTGEDGPYIVENCPVEDLEIVKEMSHGHSRKKKNVSEAKMMYHDYPKGQKPHPDVVKHAKKYYADDIFHHYNKDGHSVQYHGGDEYVSYHHVDDKGKHQGSYHYDHETRGGASVPSKKSIQKALPNSPDHVHTAIRKAIRSHIGDYDD